ncbi:hypothetical protein RclHR1_00780014 [Rhizophagus clarus]|uniref:Mid2 domain-containing protein n=1 Tax=Rhizophagus clarus TaxID=94130 RepID=A0A2Z6RYH4_9GLOM|nr:hypothetical protein RclHR1_00780014 [Rhizophagus clarus]GES87369.1 hypothetical protein GLOIN_2v477405 [Rhizophagus clarus]
MSGKGGGVGDQDQVSKPLEPAHPTTIPLPIEPPHPSGVPIPTLPFIPISPTTSINPFTTPPVTVGSAVTSTRIVTITEKNQSTVTPRKTATITSTISVSNTHEGENNNNSGNIAGIIFGIMVGLVIIGGTIVIVIRRKFSKNKGNKKNHPKSPSVGENVHITVPTTEVPEIIINDQISRRNMLHFHPQFPLPPPRPPLPQNRLPQHSPQNPPIALYRNSISTSSIRNYSPDPGRTAYTGNYYQKYMQVQLQNATDVSSSRSEQSQFSSTEIPE